jgi:hypothetical protein
VRILAASLLVACTPVYDAQYDDRKSELEESRTEFLPADLNIKLITGAQDKLFWIDVTKPLDKPVLHSFVPATGERMDYGEWSSMQFTGQPEDIRQEFLFGSSLIVECRFSPIRVYDARTPDTGMINEQSSGFKCALDGDDVYYIIDRDIFKWQPRTATPPAVIVNLDTAGVGEGSIGTLGVIGNIAVVNEGGDLWTIDLTTKQATYLMNKTITGSGFFDEVGILYDTQDGLEYTTFANGQTISVRGRGQKRWLPAQRSLLRHRRGQRLERVRDQRIERRLPLRRRHLLVRPRHQEDDRHPARRPVRRIEFRAQSDLSPAGGHRRQHAVRAQRRRLRQRRRRGLSRRSRRPSRVISAAPVA